MERLTFRVHDGGIFVKESDIKTFDVEDETMHTGNAIRKLSEYEGLEEQGKLLKLPCVVGDEVYTAGYGVGRPLKWKIISCEICEEEIVFIDEAETEWRAEDFGKTVFLTQEEAVAALQNLGV